MPAKAASKHTLYLWATVRKVDTGFVVGFRLLSKDGWVPDAYLNLGKSGGNPACDTHLSALWNHDGHAGAFPSEAEAVLHTEKVAQRFDTLMSHVVSAEVPWQKTNYYLAKETKEAYEG